MIGNEILPDWATSTEKQTNNHQWMLELGAEANFHRLCECYHYVQ